MPDLGLGAVAALAALGLLSMVVAGAAVAGRWADRRRPAAKPSTQAAREVAAVASAQVVQAGDREQDQIDSASTDARTAAALARSRRGNR